MHIALDEPSQLHLQLISAAEVEQSISCIVTRWDASEAAHETFRQWARARASAASDVVTLKAEFRQLHEALAHTLVQHGHVDEALVSRRAFVAHLIDVVEPQVPVTAPRHTYRTAA